MFALVVGLSCRSLSSCFGKIKLVRVRDISFNTIVCVRNIKVLMFAVADSLLLFREESKLIFTNLLRMPKFSYSGVREFWHT